MITNASAATRPRELARTASNLPQGYGELTGPTIRRPRLGLELRRLREAAGLRLEDAAAELGVSPIWSADASTSTRPGSTSSPTTPRSPPS
jgi:hypothetical protein